MPSYDLPQCKFIFTSCEAYYVFLCCSEAHSLFVNLLIIFKVGRSTQLLKSLGSERDRWNGSCDGFSQQMDSLIGDALLSAAFLAYSG